MTTLNLESVIYADVRLVTGGAVLAATMTSALYLTNLPTKTLQYLPKWRARNPTPGSPPISPPPTPHPASSPLLLLPPELRLQIYTHILPSPSAFHAIRLTNRLLSSEITDEANAVFHRSLRTLRSEPLPPTRPCIAIREGHPTSHHVELAVHLSEANIPVPGVYNHGIECLTGIIVETLLSLPPTTRSITLTVYPPPWKNLAPTDYEQYFEASRDAVAAFVNGDIFAPSAFPQLPALRTVRLIAPDHVRLRLDVEWRDWWWTPRRVEIQGLEWWWTGERMRPAGRYVFRKGRGVGTGWLARIEERVFGFAIKLLPARVWLYCANRAL